MSLPFLPPFAGSFIAWGSRGKEEGRMQNEEKAMGRSNAEL
jgi:hypothetical protein